MGPLGQKRFGCGTVLRSRRLLLRGPTALPSRDHPGRPPRPSLTTRSKRLGFDHRVVLRPRVWSWRGPSVEKEPPGPDGDGESEEAAPGGRVRQSPGRAGGKQKRATIAIHRIELLDLLESDRGLSLYIFGLYSVQSGTLTLTRVQSCTRLRWSTTVYTWYAEARQPTRERFRIRVRGDPAGPLIARPARRAVAAVSRPLSCGRRLRRPSQASPVPPRGPSARSRRLTSESSGRGVTCRAASARGTGLPHRWPAAAADRRVLPAGRLGSRSDAPLADGPSVPQAQRSVPQSRGPPGRRPHLWGDSAQGPMLPLAQGPSVPNIMVSTPAAARKY